MKKRVLVILSGCGVRDGSEIHEATLTLLALDRAGAEICCAAPDIPQTQCVDHFRGTAAKESRNVLTESARIARGKIVPLTQVDLSGIDAIILPGGLGVATNLCDFALTSGSVTVEPSVKNILLDAQAAGKPLGFICIAPVIAATLFGSMGVRYTIGRDQGIAARLASTGAIHVETAVTETAVDPRLKIVSTPAYMLAGRISEVEAGVSALVSDVLKMA
ncbi:MAG: isoprenoid biosynthesis glyoxalase ElbB [Verrucomicrobia bacterium]|nr:isoprenoid biosynthesis glyoxalase ElbB [Verrucomicrobiota bacterium]